MSIASRASVPCALVVLLSTLLPWSVEAQATGALEGTVLEARTGRPLRDARLEILGTDLEARTKRDGTFRFERVAAGPLVLRAALSGYVTSTDRVVVLEKRVGRVEIRLETVAAVLDEMVVLGRRSSPSPLQPASTESLPGADPLSGNAVVSVFRSSQVGSGSVLIIRGIKTIWGSNTPAVFVDGVRVSDPDPRAFSRGVGPGILDLIPPETIDSVRILRGPSAAARFGPETANGVILVYTKRGG